jgi:hypothetical protein
MLNTNQGGLDPAGARTFQFASHQGNPTLHMLGGSSSPSLPAAPALQQLPLGPPVLRHDQENCHRGTRHQLPECSSAVSRALRARGVQLPLHLSIHVPPA